jgi:hypothetical protein
MARRRRQKRDWDKARGIVFMIIGLVLISALGGAWYWVSKNRTQLDAASNCPVTGPTAIHVILIDRSDPIQPLQAQQVRQTIDRYVKSAKIGERFDLYTANGDAGNVLTAVASVCNPGRGDQANELYQNPQMIQRQFDTKFLKPLESSLVELLKSGTTKESPILESIRAAAVASFGSTEPNTIPLQMTIISDLVQHTALYSQFRTDGSFADLAKRPEWRSLQANLKGAKVDVLYLLRAEARRGNVPIQNRGHQEFWGKAFEASGADRITITPL